MELQWVQKWPLHLQTSLWPILKQKCQSQSKTKPIEWKRFIDDIFSLWDSDKKDINLFIEQANKFHPTIKLTAEISENETSFLDTIIFKGERFRNESILDIRTHYKPTKPFSMHILSRAIPWV